MTTKKINILIWIRDIAIAFIIILIALWLFTPMVITENRSMENTVYSNDFIFVSKPAYVFGDIGRGDIVVVDAEYASDDWEANRLMERVIGLPGDRVAIHSAGVYINDVLLDEPYTKQGITLGTIETVTVPEDSFFLLGDNRLDSIDSREPEVGFVSKDDIAGKVVFRLFPISRIGTVK
jgi:signal peptidase I